MMKFEQPLEIKRSCYEDWQKTRNKENFKRYKSAKKEV